MTDRLDELQRLHDAATTQPHAVPYFTDAAKRAMPALLRVARAAAKLCDNNQSSNWVLSDHSELFAALAELRGIEERRRVERFVAAELAMGLDKEQWDGHLQPEPFDASGNPWCPTCKAWHERSPGTMLWIKCKDGGA